ncbi:hypothetical protein ETAA8_47540 [Anatilimnocola aggregata]|uniref:Uncharacterized protein n=1 Tax=Anatilimnocola aggregata TaxID=2528021 RepID=A0A517YHE9_9BACT|nr:hypothetical protein [Anatilimnocola aggregata]QDU29639.1 hypothetical protein ETAA8_47540 [Anatilimnocola aggregata]
MRSRFGVFLLLIVVLVIGFSFYRGYLTLSSRQQPTTNNSEIKLIVDQDKLKADTDRAGAEVKRLTGDVDLKPGS